MASTSKKNEGGPYNSPVRCRVLCCGSPTTYKGKDGDDKQSLTAAISDGVHVYRLNVYDATKFKYVKVSC